MKYDNQSTIALLATLGIARTETLTYLALLELESVSIRKIAAHTGINRGTTHEALKRLITLGLASVKQQGTREHYTAEPPDTIFNIIREKRRDLLETAAEAKKIVPDLTARKTNVTGRPLVRYYEDDEGVVTILKDVLQTCRDLDIPEYCAYSSSLVRQYLYRKFPLFTKRRIAERITVKVIAVGDGGEVADYSERKWLHGSNESQVSSYTIIYGNKVAIISIAADNTPYGVVIEDAGGASMQRLLFDQLWRFIDD
ncbi:MAG: TrmB family transcriptional regulator [Candidatus Saccharibacteria bacterium]